MTVWTLTTFTTRHGAVRQSFPTEAAARAHVADVLAEHCTGMPDAATFTAAGGGMYALAPKSDAVGPAYGAPTHAEQRAHTIATALRANGWWVAMNTEDEAGVRTVRMYAGRGKHENGAALTFTSELAKPNRSKLGRCYQSTAYDTIAMGTVTAVMRWCSVATMDYRPASREYTERGDRLDLTPVCKDAPAAELEAPAAEVVEVEVLEAAAAVVDAAAAELVDAPAPAAEAAPVVIVACGSAKLERRAAAGEMYTGTYHRATRRAAAALAGAEGRVLILSARYGLLELGTEIDPYEQRLPARKAPAAWVAMVREQAEALGLADAAPVVLAGAVYVAAAREVWSDVSAPLAGTAGIGEQLARLAAIYRPAEALELVAAASVSHTTPAIVPSSSHVSPVLGTVRVHPLHRRNAEMLNATPTTCRHGAVVDQLEVINIAAITAEDPRGLVDEALPVEYRSAVRDRVITLAMTDLDGVYRVQQLHTDGCRTLDTFDEVSPVPSTVAEMFAHLGDVMVPGETVAETLHAAAYATDAPAAEATPAPPAEGEVPAPVAATRRGARGAVRTRAEDNAAELVDALTAASWDVRTEIIDSAGVFVDAERVSPATRTVTVTATRLHEDGVIYAEWHSVVEGGRRTTRRGVCDHTSADGRRRVLRSAAALAAVVATATAGVVRPLAGDELATVYYGPACRGCGRTAAGHVEGCRLVEGEALAEGGPAGGWALTAPGAELLAVALVFTTEDEARFWAAAHGTGPMVARPRTA